MMQNTGLCRLSWAAMEKPIAPSSQTPIQHEDNCDWHNPQKAISTLHVQAMPPRVSLSLLALCIRSITSTRLTWA